ncbi:MAG: TonB family protein, partial [Sedimenticolaceae bacterium]
QDPEPPTPMVVEKPPPDSRPPVNRVARVRPELKEKRPPKVRPVAAVPVKIAAAEVERPQPEVPLIDVQKRQHYLAALAARINRSKYYPRASRRRGEEGTVVVSFVIQRDGELTDFVVTESSGHERLDTAALKTLRRVTPFEPIPDVIGRDQWPISVPIAYSLGG